MSFTRIRQGILGTCLVGPSIAVLGFTACAAAGEQPQAITVTGIVRDFKEWTVEGGHPDFERRPNAGYARYSGNVATTLDNSRKPAFTGAGHKVANEYYDARHRPICYALYDAALGDTEGSWAQAGTGGIQSADTFAQWYRDDPELNLSQPLDLTLVLQADGNYVFDDEMDPDYQSLGGFFPIDDQLFGNSPGIPEHNFHFTFELHLECEYDPDAGQFFMFTGDDDVFVFVNGQLVIDLGGVHAAHDQYVDMNRLSLPPGETYLIDFYFAERHRPQSNFRIETNIPVRTAPPYNFTAIYD